MKIEVISFRGCPHAEQARVNVREAISTAGIAVSVVEWDRDEAGAPPYVRGYPSPTVLVDGRDVSGDAGTSDHASCRTAGAPSAESILQALRDG